MEELRKREVETIIDLLKQCYDKNLITNGFGQFMVNTIFGRVNPFYIENRIIINKLTEFLRDSESNNK